ncbi:hypothetical protein BSF38_02314 [Paludisphaera borealis]|uniref:Uncharacterized protein n=1 Tax=Paludisphaera borealis TaxID=1387353 RepID=A0A1U7CPL6_9BACT|nr:hypothetical protein BSF38_02314 [Paludisphaera borealis]
MKPPRMQFTIRRLMLAVSVVALILAPARFARHAVPHFLRCRVLCLQADDLSRMCRSLAALYRDCGLPHPPSPFIYYCDDPNAVAIAELVLSNTMHCPHARSAGCIALLDSRPGGERESIQASDSLGRAAHEELRVYQKT